MILGLGADVAAMLPPIHRYALAHGACTSATLRVPASRISPRATSCATAVPFACDDTAAAAAAAAAAGRRRWQ